MKYFALLTTYGEKVLAEATALGTKIELTHMAVGDGGGTLPAPDTKQTKLVNEKRRAAINTLFIDSVNTNQVIAEQVIPENEGGWWIREIGLFDKSGLLVAVANCPETYKPLLAEGSGRTQTIRMILIVSHTESVTLKIDPTVVLATRQYVDDVIQVLDKRITELTASDVGAVPITRKVNNKQLNVDITLYAGDVGAYTKAETDTKVADAKKAGIDAQTTANSANTAATNANNNANGRVPSGRKVNNKALSGDISLTAGDVGAYTKAETDTKVADAKKAGTDAQTSANSANTAATNANNNANGRVPSGRKVNGKPLTTDISLTAGDVGAYTKAEVDARVANLNLIYPVGIVVWFAQNKNPNTLFPNTKWQYVGENKTIRLAKADGSNVFKLGGKDSITLVAGQLPVHAHSFSAATSSAGGHNHNRGSMDVTGDFPALRRAGNHQDASLKGAFSILRKWNAGNSWSGNDDDGTIYNFTASRTWTGVTSDSGVHTHTISGTTGNAGSGSAIDITNAFITLMGWYRIS
ncbi:phage tail protein [Providencia sp. wls1950]|uniref:phage tail protein n=1 Tax=Providencia sp. wls1950 TaxID=2675147 RepID=UPI001E3A69F1|nr:phage tail protein [Providencia sp. wls1950]